MAAEHEEPNIRPILGVRFEQRQAVHLLQSQQELARIADDLIAAIVKLQAAVAESRIVCEGDLDAS